MTWHCPKCGNVVLENAGFCAYCGTPIRIVQPIEIRRSGLPVAGGVLQIISACICVIVATISMAVLATSSYSYYYYYYSPWGFWFVGAFGLIGFAFGLVGGILALRRKYFETALIGASLVMISGLISVTAWGALPYSGFVFALFGIPTIILSALGLIFIAASKMEFA